MDTAAINVAQRLSQLTLEECAAGIGATRLTPRLRAVAVSPFIPLARRLGREIARFDEETASSLQNAARALLTRLYVTPEAVFDAPLAENGPLLIIANHPGVYDAMVLFASIPRQDLRLIAAEREFLRAMPQLSRHLAFVPDPHATDSVSPRGQGLLDVMTHLKRGGTVLHFAAGQIEPDPAFATPEQAVTLWPSGTGVLAQACVRFGGSVVVAMVSGVHAARIKQSWLVRVAEARGVSTLAGLLQIALPRLAPVAPRVRFSTPLSAADLAATRNPDDAKAMTAKLQATARQLLAR